MKKDLLLLMHDDESTTGTTAEWCKSRNIHFEQRNAAKFGFFSHPSARDYRGVIVFGGNMEAWEEEKHPWLKKERKLVCDFVTEQKGVFGICLGVQILARCQGARAYPLGEWQIGWADCTLKQATALVRPLLWHSSSFDLPEGAELTAWNDRGVKLGFRTSPRVLGYQFHTEIDPERLEQALENWKPELEGAVDTPEKIRADATKAMADLKAWYFAELDSWWAALKS